jgi:hypothetical protein
MTKRSVRMVAPSGYVAEVDAALCNLCGACELLTHETCSSALPGRHPPWENWLLMAEC